MNRYNFSEAEIKRALSGVNVPNFMKKYPFKAKGNKLFLEGREVIPNEQREAYLRKILYDKNSDYPLARDSLFYLLKKEVINISKRFIESFLKKQDVIVERTAKPRKEKRKFVVNIKKAGAVSGDLVHIEKNDLPDGYMPDIEQEDMNEYIPGAGNKPNWSKVKKTYYMYNIVDKLTGYLCTEIVPSKDERIIWAATQKLFDRMAKALNTPVKVLELDQGSEFNLSEKNLKKQKVTVKRMRTNALVESVNAKLQRIFYTLVKQRRSGFYDSIKKSVEISNNTFNRKLGMTPNEAVEKLLGGETLKRRDGTHPKPILKKDAYEVGQKVRALKIARAKEKPGYKAYKGKHWGAVQTITRVVFYQGYPRYELDGKKRTIVAPDEYEVVDGKRRKKKKKPQGVSLMKWHDQLSRAEDVDRESKDIIAGREIEEWVSPALRPKPKAKQKSKYKVDEIVTFTFKGNEYDARLKSHSGDDWVIWYKSHGKVKELTVSESRIKPRVYKVDEVVTFTFKGVEYDARLKSHTGNDWVIWYKSHGEVRELTVSESRIKPR